MNQIIQNTSLEEKAALLVSNQRAFFNTHVTKSIDFRIIQLKKLKGLLSKHEEEMHDAIYHDFGKSKYESQLIETQAIYKEIDIAIKNLKKWAKKKRVKTNLINFPAKSYLVAEPLGVSLVIGAWNFPYNLSLIPVIGSIAAGNTTILKPSELTARSSQMMAKIINDNFDPNYLRVVEGGIPEATALLKQRFDKIFFTGSSRVGKIVAKAAAENLTDVTLELGGKNPAIFTKNCNLKMSVKRMIWAKFINAGQFCITADYALVHKDIKEEFLQLAVKEIKKHQYANENHNYVKIINERNFDRIANLIDPEKVHFGGTFRRDERHIDPTILNNVSMEDAVMQEEIFGPILPIVEFESLEEAFDIVKTFEKPISAYLFSENKEEKERFLNEISFGSASINDCLMQIANHNLPFGGVGNSGMGRYHGKYSFECFSHYKAIMDKPTYLETNLKYYGYSEWIMKLIKLLR